MKRLVYDKQYKEAAVKLAMSKGIQCSYITQITPK